MPVTPGACWGIASAKKSWLKTSLLSWEQNALHQVCTPVVVEMAKERLVLASAVLVT